MSNKKYFTDLIRGSQLTSHNMRMFGQGMRTILLINLSTMAIWFMYKLHSKVNLFDLYYWTVYKWIKLKYEAASIFGASSGIKIAFYSFSHNQWVETTGNKFINWLPAKYAIYHMNQAVDWLCSIDLIIDLLLSFSVGMMISVGIFIYKGKKNRARQFERGGVIVEPKKLAAILASNGEASTFKIEGLPYVKDSETTHTLLVGTTGAGKTNCLHKLLPQIRAKKQKAIIVDLNGSFVSKYYREGKDHILNPFDKRCKPWSPWADCLYIPHYDAFAKAMIPGDNHRGDKFWDQSAQILLSTVLKKLKEQGKDKNSILCKTLFTDNVSSLEAFVVGTPAAALIDPAGEKMTASIRATLNTQVNPLQYIKDAKHPFSIREWLQSPDDSWLFLTSSPDQRETLNPLISAWLDIALNGLMALQVDYNRRIWFMLDELPALQKVPCLKTGAAEARKYGGCIVAGIQNLAQLDSIYGYSEAENLRNLFNTIFIFRTQDTDTQTKLSRLLGEQESIEVQENKQYGANTHRDGVSLNQVRKRELLVIPTELGLLENLECYVKLAGNRPITKLKMTLEHPKTISPEFIFNDTMKPLQVNKTIKRKRRKAEGAGQEGLSEKNTIKFPTKHQGQLKVVNNSPEESLNLIDV